VIGGVEAESPVAPGFHVNSNTPSDDYLIPLKITWAAGARSRRNRLPQAKLEKYSFSEKPISVFSAISRW